MNQIQMCYCIGTTRTILQTNDIKKVHISRQMGSLPYIWRCPTQGTGLIYGAKTYGKSQSAVVASILSNWRKSRYRLDLLVLWRLGCLCLSVKCLCSDQTRNRRICGHSDRTILFIEYSSHECARINGWVSPLSQIQTFSQCMWLQN